MDNERYFGQTPDEEAKGGCFYLVAATGLLVLSHQINNFALAHHIPYLEAMIKTGIMQDIEKFGALFLYAIGYASLASSIGPHFDDEPPPGGHDSI